MKNIKILSVALAVITSLSLLLSGCGKTATSSTASNTTSKNKSTVSLSADDMFSDRDYETGFDESEATKIEISDTNSKISITKAGTYILSGSTSDGSITVDVADTDKVQIVLNGVSVTSKTSAALYIKSADKVFVTTTKALKIPFQTAVHLSK